MPADQPARPASPSRVINQSRPPFQSLTSNTTSMGTTSFASTASTSTQGSVLLSDAPTPFNTYSAPDAFGSISFNDTSDLGNDSANYGNQSSRDFENDQEIMHDPLNGSLGLRQSNSVSHSLSSSSSPRPGLSSLFTTTSDTSSANLLPSSAPSTIGRADTQSIPYSSRPVPAPPTIRFGSSTQGSNLFDTPGSGTSPLPTAASQSSSFSKLLDSESTSGSRSNLEAGSRKEPVDIDAQRLRQLGYDAVLGRDYTFWSSLSISTVCIGCLQGVVFGVSGAYRYGGPLMILTAWPVSCLFSTALTATLAELASAYPVSGAMSSWAWKLARGGVGRERGWGWLMGGVVLGGHLGNVLMVTWQICKIIAGVMEMSSDYELQKWQMVCFFLAIILGCGIVGGTAWGRSHRFWLSVGAYFLAVYLILNVSLLVSIAQHKERKISLDFYNSTGWSSKAYVGLIGWQACTIASGADASAHMAEETQNPQRNVPNAMIVAQAGSYLLGYITIILLLLAVKAEDAIETSKHPFPFGHILERAINRPVAITIVVLIVVVLFFQVLAQLQASSRFMFALARDNAMPFAETVRYTNRSKNPIIANWVVNVMCLPFSLLLISNENILYSVTTVTAASLSSWGYVVPVLLYIFSGKDLQTEGRTSWSLRKASKPVGAMGAVYGIAVIVTQWMPPRHPVSINNISWSPVILAGTAATCLLTWVLYGRKHYSGPIRAVTKWETGVEIDLQSALASQRSRPSAGPGDSTSKHLGESVITSLNYTDVSDNGLHHRPGIRRQELSDDSYKHHIEDSTYGDALRHTVTVQSAKTVEHNPEMTEWSDTSGATSTSEWTDATITRDDSAGTGELQGNQHSGLPRPRSVG